MGSSVQIWKLECIIELWGAGESYAALKTDSVDEDEVLCFDLLTRPKMPFKVMHRKEVTHSNGSYERKSRGRKLADEMGRGKKKIPLYSHRPTHRKRVTSELHDSYFRSMTITQAIPKIAEVTHPVRQISEEIAEACPYHHVGVWSQYKADELDSWVELELELDEM